MYGIKYPGAPSPTNVGRTLRDAKRHLNEGLEICDYVELWEKRDKNWSKIKYFRNREDVKNFRMGKQMRISFLTKRFDDNKIFYAPDLELPEAKNIIEECYPAVRIHQNFVELAEYFFLLVSEIGEYEEYNKHPEKGIYFSMLGGRKEIEKRFQEMYEKKIYDLDMVTINENAR